MDDSLSTRVIGIDPGSTTGIALIAAADDEVKVLNALHLPSNRVGQWLDREIRQREIPWAVVVERFTISARTIRGTRSGALEALYTIGVIRYLCEQADVPMILQAPSTVKNAFNDDRLRRLGLDRKVHGPHERDALRHALVYATTRGLWSGMPRGNGAVA